MEVKKKKAEEYNTMYNTYSNQNQNGIQELDEYKNLVKQKTSALASANLANQQAVKNADLSALAQGYATQGARLQNMASLQNAYQNQVGNINANYQTQLGNLQNTNSQNAFENFQSAIASSIEKNNLTDEKLQEIKNTYGPLMDEQTLKNADIYLNDLDYANNTNNQEGVTQDYSFVSSANNTNASTNFYQGSGVNKNINVTVNGTTYKAELGPLLYKMSPLFDKGEDKLKFKDKKVGEIFEVEYKQGKYYLAIKDENGDIRVLERVAATGNGINQFKYLANSLGFNGNNYEDYSITGDMRRAK